MDKRTVFIQGMETLDDANKVSRALNEVWGIDKAEVSLARKEATFSFDESSASFHDFRQAIRDLGFEVTPRDDVTN